MSPRLDSWWSGSFPLPGREFHPLEAPGLSWRTKEAPDIQIENPVITPASFSRLTHCVQCRLPRSISVGISMKRRLYFRLQSCLDYLLRNAIGYCGNTQFSFTTVFLCYLHRPHRWRKVTAR